MARNDEEAALERLERQAWMLGIDALPLMAGEPELADKFRWIAGLLEQAMREETPAKRRPIQRGISKRIKELSDVVREKHIQHHLPFRCIDEYDECVRKRKKQKKSPYLCSVALFICLVNSMKALLAAMAAGAVTGGLLR